MRRPLLIIGLSAVMLSAGAVLPLALAQSDNGLVGAHRFIRTSVTASPKLLAQPSNSSAKFMQFTVKTKYLGEDYSFGDLSENVVGSVVCSLGSAKKQDQYGGFMAPYRFDGKIVYEGPLPLRNGQEQVFNVLVPVPAKYVTLLKTKAQQVSNVCWFDMNLIANFKSVGVNIDAPNWAKALGFAPRAYMPKLLIGNRFTITPKLDWGY